MRTGRLVFVVGVLAGIVGFGESPSTQGPSAAFYGVGDLDTPAVSDSFFSVIRDATRVGTEIHAVGGGVAFRNCSPSPICPPPGLPNSTLWPNDTAIRWVLNGVNGTLEALPHIDANTAPLPLLGANDISPDGRFIASQARRNAVPGPGFAPRAVRVDTTLLGASGANFDLNTVVSPAVTAPTTALAISDDGTVVWGMANQIRAMRFVDTATPSVTFIAPFAGQDRTTMPPRGASWDGNVAVGSSFTSTLPNDHRAFRYEAGVVSAIPTLDGGTVNDAVAVSRDGDLVLLTGNSPHYPNGEAYLWNKTTGAKTPFGAPNGSASDPWRPGGLFCAAGECNPPSFNIGGMSDDGSVVVMNFMGAPGIDGSYEYFRNQHGWFRLVSALAANGVDIAAAGWDNLFIQGISPDGTLVFGAGEHNGVVEGFVADFGSAAIALKDFNPTPVAPADTSIVGAWTNDFDDPKFVFVFTDDGAYYHIEDTQFGYGFERGFYEFDGSSIKFTTLVDTNGSVGASGANGVTVPLTVNFDEATFGTSPDPDVAYRIVGSPGTFVGAWVSGEPTLRDSSFAGVALANGELFEASDNLFSPGDEAGKDTYTFTSAACPTVLPAGLDCYALFITNDGVNYVGLTPDGLTGIGLDDDGQTINELRRVIDPAAIPVISNTPLVASGVQDQPFSFDVDASLPVTFTATGLPSGFSIDFNTGIVSGTPTVGGQFVITIKALSPIGVADVESLVLTVAIPTPIGQDVTIQPVVSEGQGPVTLTFDDVTSAGETTVEAVSLADLQGSGVPPPGNINVGGVIYDVQTTASFTGLIELCFSYTGIDFGTAQPRLFHYENNTWVDITTSVDTQTETICGATTSLSPFAILKSDVDRRGFYAPVNPIAGFLNTVKAGSTVPLKFEVFVDGVEKTTTTGIAFSTHVIACDPAAPEDPVETTTVQGGSGLRYDTAVGQFILNWKVPTTKGCYLVQVTTFQDALGLTARFKVQ